MTLPIKRLRFAWVLFVIAMGLILHAAWIPLKAGLAQALLDVAWTQTAQTGEATKPWPWADHSAVAKLYVPSHDIEQVVLSGDSGAVLAFAPGENIEAARAEGAARIISGHRDTHFRFLQYLQAGDEMQLETANGIARYRMLASKVVDSTTTTLNPTAIPDGLILVTCYPFDALTAGGSERYVVFAEPVLPSETI